MDEGDARTLLAAVVADGRETFTALSRLIGRNDAYLQQFVRRGTPRALSERDRALLAGYLEIDEAALGGPRRAAPVVPAAVRRLDIGASAGPGRIVEDEGEAGLALLDPRLLRLLGVRAATASIIRVEGDSMAPLLADGDDILVDRASRRPGSAGGIFVVRLDGLVMVKRVAAAGRQWRVTSDNPDHDSPGMVDRAALEVIGRVVWQSRVLV